MPSNVVGFSIYSPAPDPTTGWTLMARKHDGTLMESNVPFIDLSFTLELSDVGGGTVTLDFASPYWTDDVVRGLTITDVLATEFIWEAYEGTQLRAAWLNTKTTDDQIDPSLTRQVKLAGPGIGQALEWSKVFPPNYPTVPPFFWSTVQPRMYQWARIWLECVDRTPATSLQRQFSFLFAPRGATTADLGWDTNGVKWKDPETEIQQENGVGMKTLLENHCQAIKADYYITPDRKIDVRYDFGVQRPEVVFASPQMTVLERELDRSDVENVVVARDDQGNLTTILWQSSIDLLGWREKMVNSGRAATPASRLAAATSELTWHKYQISTWSIQVPTKTYGSDGEPYYQVFVDYDLGDWINIMYGAAKINLQIQAITLKVDSSGQETLELTLESLAQVRRRKYENALNSGTNGTNGSNGGSGSGYGVLFREQIFHLSGVQTEFTLDFLPLTESEDVTIGMKKYMETDGSGSLAQREFTRKLERNVKWKRSGWTVTILDTSIFDEDPT